MQPEGPRPTRPRRRDRRAGEFAADGAPSRPSASEPRPHTVPPIPIQVTSDDLGPPPTLTFVFIVRPSAYAHWNEVGRREQSRALAPITSEVVVNQRHGVNPDHSVLLELTGSPAALWAAAASLAVDAAEREHLAQRIAATVSRRVPSRRAEQRRDGWLLDLPGRSS